MVNEADLSPALRGKSRAEQLRLIETIIDAGKRGRFPLPKADNGLLLRFCALLGQGRAVDDPLLVAVSTVVRHYEQHLIALTRSTR